LNIEPCEKKPGSVSAEIARMQEYKLFITTESTNIAKELNNYRWNDKKAGIPHDSHNHTIDAARYAFARLTTRRPSLGLL
jgi:phage terminase large subunit